MILEISRKIGRSIRPASPPLVVALALVHDGRMVAAAARRLPSLGERGGGGQPQRPELTEELIEELIGNPVSRRGSRSSRPGR